MSPSESNDYVDADVLAHVNFDADVGADGDLSVRIDIDVDVDVYACLDVMSDVWGGGVQQGNRFVLVVRAYARTGCKVQIGRSSRGSPFPFPFSSLIVFLFPMGNPHPPNLLSRFGWPYQ